MKDWAIICNSGWGPHFHDIHIWNDGKRDTGLDWSMATSGAFR
jgi:hypothetical protein